MRRFQIPHAALVAGLAVLLSGCSGETPTAPSSNGGTGNGSGSGGSCTVLVSMSATTQSPIVGTASIVRATVTKSGVPVPDGGSVQYTTDLGLFEENGLNTISKTTVGGVADVTVFSANGGTAHVKAVFGCANAQINLQFGGIPDVGPYISSLSPTTGSCAGGDTVTILGGRFGNARQARSRLTQSRGAAAFHWMRILLPLGASNSITHSSSGVACGAISSTNAGLEIGRAHV